MKGKDKGADARAGKDGATIARHIAATAAEFGDGLTQS
jgi:hypothetical protein